MTYQRYIVEQWFPGQYEVVDTASGDSLSSHASFEEAQDDAIGGNYEESRGRRIPRLPFPE